MPHLVLGNTAPIEARKLDENTTDVERVSRDDLGQTETTFDIPAEWSLSRQIDVVRSVYLSHHSDEPPAWVESTNDPEFAEIIAKEFDVPVGRPDDWGDKASAITSAEGSDGEDE